jgi:hypothetical protein
MTVCKYNKYKPTFKCTCDHKYNNIVNIIITIQILQAKQTEHKHLQIASRTEQHAAQL